MAAGVFRHFFAKQRLLLAFVRFHGPIFETEKPFENVCTTRGLPCCTIAHLLVPYRGIITGEDGVVRLSAQELDSAFALRLQVSLLQDAFQTGRSTIGVHKHLRYPLSFCDIAGVPALNLLNSHGIEVRTYFDHLCDWTEELPADSSSTSEPKRVHIEAPRGIEVNVKHTRLPGADIGCVLVKQQPAHCNQQLLKISSITYQRSL